MTTLKFNKSLSTKRLCKDAGIIFRRLADTGNEPRYQGSVNKNGADLINSIYGYCASLNISFSDEHPMIGFKPLASDSGVMLVFGATNLFKSLNLVTGKYYNLEKIGEYAVIDSDEHN